ncbi:LysR family transcriptional regulator [Allofranklinella schreckenbergeri]|uniref:LysR family transcriptional regulator n=1 Tax=Allofranklinella schreckenbergeri TaxID=1076744 RepID=A0A3M6PVJ4_9BURK|nr:LysR family transcriptional regulator [Allofranklinella schreckenbergeri]RMW95113.1 LysR family transcriptional regulator [Allofranklinella schreckenbergeri]
MNLKQIEIFVTVAELGSFSKAAQVLGTAQPALSRQVRQLEVALHEHLFARNGRGVELTEAGQRMLLHGRTILQTVANARADFGAHRQEPVGRATIGLPPSIARRITVPLIQRFKSHLPKARLEVVEGLSSHMTGWLIDGQMDMALLYNPQPHLSLSITPLARERLCLIGRQDSLPPGPVAFGDLPRYPLVMAQKGQIFRSLMEAQALLHGTPLNVAWEVASLPVIFDLLKAGHGFAVLTETALDSHQERGDSTLDARLIHTPEIPCTLCLAQRAHYRESLLIQRTKAELVALVERVMGRA